MDENIRITLETASTPEDERTLQSGLRDYNYAIAGPSGYQPLHLMIRDENGALIGGLLGDTYWGWLAINIFWLRDDLRGQGLGSRLLGMAEAEALRRGCKNVHLDTFDFQALDFYRKRGYTLFGQLGDLPLGHARYYLRKKLE